MGNEEAFTRLFHAYYPLLSTHVFRITQSLPVTEEIVQDVFLKIWMGRESLTQVQSFKAFVWVMARNLSFNALKKIAREQTVKQSYQRSGAAAHTTEEHTEFYHTLIDEAIALLPPQQQKVYLLSRQEKWKQAEIAANMGITLSTVKKYMQRAVDSITTYVRNNGELLLLTALLLLN